MKDIAVAMMVVGLCFYNAHLTINKQESSWLASLFAILGAIHLIL